MENYLIIAKITFKDITRQPLLYVILIGGILLILLASPFTMFAFGEEARLIRDMGITTITLSGLIISIFYTSMAFNTEMTRVVLATILSKPINKGDFIVGKFLGTGIAVFLVDIIMVVFLLIMLTLYDSRDTLKGDWRLIFYHVYSVMDIQLLLGIYSAFLQTIILGAISLLLSIILPPVANISICFTLYVVGHLSNCIFSYLEKAKGITALIPVAIFTIIPNLQNLDLWNANADIFNNKGLFFYLFYISAYTVCYVSFIIGGAVLAFRQRDMQ